MEPAALNISQSLTRLSVSLVASAIVIIATYCLYLQITDASGTQTAAAYPVTFGDRQVIAGKAESTDRSVTISSFELQSLEYYALLVWQTAINADDFPFVEYTMHTDLPGVMLSLVWRNADKPQEVHSTTLSVPPSGKAMSYLAGHPQWRGEIIELGVHVTARNQDTEVSISDINLLPYSTGNSLIARWDSWRHFREWSQSSINNLVLENRRGLPYLTTAAASWAALAVLLLLVWNRLAPGTTGGLLLAAAFVPWFTVDLFWQKHLQEQLSITIDSFAGKSSHEKHLADLDEPLYSYAQYLKEEVLPKKPARILLIHNSDGHNFVRLKFQYYLLPHNIFNFDVLPPRGQENSVDYVLLLGTTPPREIQAEGGLLRQNHRSLSVQLINRDPMGYLFKVKHLTQGQQ